MRGVTEKQQLVLDFIADFIVQQGMPPTVYEIADHFEVSTPTAFNHLRALQRKGLIERSSKARSLTLVNQAQTQVANSAISVPIVGQIAAGAPLLAEQHIEDVLELDAQLLPGGIAGHRIFGLRVKGESMYDRGIHDGDIIIARGQRRAEAGEVVIALVDDEATVKLFHPRGKRVELRPASAAYKTQIYQASEVAIQGVVIALFRKF